jgi:carbonic anhydrase
MARLGQRRDQFVRGLVEIAGWDEARAVRHFEDSAPKFGIRDEVEFVLLEAERLRTIYPRIAIAPLLYRVEDDFLYQLRPDAEVSGGPEESCESDSDYTTQRQITPVRADG